MTSTLTSTVQPIKEIKKTGKTYTIINTHNPRTISVSSLEEALTIRKFYSENLLTDTNRCKDNYFVEYNHASLISFWNYAVQMFNRETEIGTIQITINFTDKIECVVT